MSSNIAARNDNRPVLVMYFCPEAMVFIIILPENMRSRLPELKNKIWNIFGVVFRGIKIKLRQDGPPQLWLNI